MQTHAREALYTVGEEIAHALTHGLGLVLSIAGAALLVAAASLRGDAWHVVGCAVFGTTLVLLYAASTTPPSSC
jgi:hemolysin III